MQRFAYVLFLLLVVGSLGCSREQPKPEPPPAPTALSIEEWKTLPLDEKYDGGTLDRLRINNPKLKTDQQWGAFFKRVVVPERKKDYPNG